MRVRKLYSDNDEPLAVIAVLLEQDFEAERFERNLYR